jgi:hypothetical protein
MLRMKNNYFFVWIKKIKVQGSYINLKSKKKTEPNQAQSIMSSEVIVLLGDEMEI